jgi:hypothetical protein
MYLHSVQGGKKQLLSARAGKSALPRKEVCVMTETPSKRQIVLARLVILLIIAFSAFGLVRYGLSDQARQGFWRDMRARPGGPMTFRFILQPAMAAFAAFRDGLKDARAGRSPYLWTILANRAERVARLNEGLISTAQIILLGLGMDVIYQFIVLNTFYPGQAVVIALVLAFIPYLLLRGPIARIVCWWRGDASLDKKGHRHGR